MDRPKKTEAVESKEDAYPVQGTPLVHQADDRAKSCAVAISKDQSGT